MLVSPMFAEPMIFPVRLSSTDQAYQPLILRLSRFFAWNGSGAIDGEGATRGALRSTDC